MQTRGEKEIAILYILQTSDWPLVASIPRILNDHKTFQSLQVLARFQLDQKYKMCVQTTEYPTVVDFH